MKTKEKILIQINEVPGLTLGELCKEFFKSKGNISIHLKDLEKEELVQKIIIKNNNKIFGIHPTKKGKERYLKLKSNFIFFKKSN